jgi:glycine/D-amino acid oxidase-like deaminating enzyme/nitrite reductase/ring-hydroxylating ferredoxin subunit
MTRAVWQATAHEARFPALKGGLRVDVAIIGGGITGITTAMLLTKGGMKVAVLEADKLGAGATGHSTGNLYALIDAHLQVLAAKWDPDTMTAVVHSRQDAIDLIEFTVHAHNLDCAFARRPFCLFAPTTAREHIELIEREYRAAIDAHLNARVVKELPLPLRVEKALVVEGQAQFHPLNYVRDLARKIASDLCLIFEYTPVTQVDAEHGVLHTDAGQVHADKIVMATHTPKGRFAVHAQMEVYREPALGARLRAGPYPEGIFWSIGDKHSIRSLHAGGRDYLIAVGGKYKTGHEVHTEQRAIALERFVRDHFPVEAVSHAWSAQQYRPADLLPYIGKSSGHERVYLATGFASDGLTYGALAAMIISEDIFGRENKWSDLYDPARLTPLKPVKARETLDTAAKIVRDAFTRSPADSEVPRGEGRLLDIEGEKVAAFCDHDNRVVLLSSTCTHMGCTVQWNAGEQTWDCPCHGSRFTVQGDVIEGPALVPLSRYGVPVETAPGSETGPAPPRPE